jgi:hypothetical protein
MNELEFKLPADFIPASCITGVRRSGGNVSQTFNISFETSTETRQGFDPWSHADTIVRVSRDKLHREDRLRFDRQ